ncbi:MAG: alanine racemase [Deltaproteobacteria bacterium]|nr:alanine racemase [Deltaproteobacteria bacterium]
MKLEELDTPAAWVDLDVMEQNLERMGDYCKKHSLALRPHIKTHKTPELAYRQLDSGAVGITSAKVTEAEVMASAGLDDILIAYPVWGEHKWRRLAELARHATISIATDSVEHAHALAGGMGEAAGQISLLVEVDIGSGRTGLPIDKSFPERLNRIAGAGIPVKGLMIYPGYIMEIEEGTIESLGEKISSVVALYEKSGLELSVVSGGSTPTAFYTHLLPSVTEIRPGTYIFNDCNCVRIGAAAWENCALKVRCRVVSTSVAGGAIIDGGSKTFSDAVGIHASGFGRLVQCPEVICEKMNEEHGYLKLEGSGFSPGPGDLVDVIPNHACTTVNMHHVLYGVRNGEVEEIWHVAAQGKIH